MDSEQLIQDYIANRLSEKERTKVEAMLKTDAEFKSEFDIHYDTTMAFKVSEANTLKQHFKNLESNSTTKTSLIQKYKYIYLAIASMIIIGFFYTNFNKESGEELFNSNFEIYPNTYQPVTRSSESNTSNTAFVAYENSDFSTSENVFASLLKISENPNFRFYYATSLINQSKFNLALKEFKKLNKIDFDYRSESLWYSALISIRNEDYLKAKDYLIELKELDTKFKIEEIKLLLENLNER